MTCYLIEYSDYLRGLQVSDFADRAALDTFMRDKRKEPEWPLVLKNPEDSAFAVESDLDLMLPHMGAGLRRDLYGMLMPGELELAAGREISPSELFLRIELFMKEE